MQNALGAFGELNLKYDDFSFTLNETLVFLPIIHASVKDRGRKIQTALRAAMQDALLSGEKSLEATGESTEWLLEDDSLHV